MSIIKPSGKSYFCKYSSQLQFILVNFQIDLPASSRHHQTPVSIISPNETCHLKVLKTKTITFIAMLLPLKANTILQKDFYGKDLYYSIFTVSLHFNFSSKRSKDRNIQGRHCLPGYAYKNEE
jgi:hypothetical protein